MKMANQLWVLRNFLSSTNSDIRMSDVLVSKKGKDSIYWYRDTMLKNHQCSNGVISIVKQK